MEMGDRHVRRRPTQTKRFDKRCARARDMAVCYRTTIRRELSNGSRRSSNSSKPNSTTPLPKSSSKVRTPPPHFPHTLRTDRFLHSQSLNPTVNQMSTRVDALETSIQDILNVDFPPPPPGGIPQSPSVGSCGPTTSIRRSPVNLWPCAVLAWLNAEQISRV